jgi:ketosteroid isomerase-like protein
LTDEFSCDASHLIPASCGKEAFQPHFMRFFSIWNLKMQQKPLFSDLVLLETGQLCYAGAIASACHNACPQ